MWTIEQLRAALEPMNLQKVAEGAGVHYNTVQKIAKGTNKNPSYASVVRLVEYLERIRNV